MAKVIHIDENTSITDKEYIGLIVLASVGAGAVMYKGVGKSVEYTNKIYDAVKKKKSKHINQEGA